MKSQQPKDYIQQETHKFQTRYVEGVSIGNILRFNSGALTHKTSICWENLCCEHCEVKLWCSYS